MAPKLQKINRKRTRQIAIRKNEPIMQSGAFPAGKADSMKDNIGQPRSSYTSPLINSVYLAYIRNIIV